MAGARGSFVGLRDPEEIQRERRLLRRKRGSLRIRSWGFAQRTGTSGERGSARPKILRERERDPPWYIFFFYFFLFSPFSFFVFLLFLIFFSFHFISFFSFCFLLFCFLFFFFCFFCFLCFLFGSLFFYIFAEKKE